MPTAPNPADIFIGAGKVYFDRFDANGNSTGFRFLGNATKFEINPSAETEDIWNMTKKSRTKLAKIVKTQTHTIAMDLDEFNPKNLAIALLGSSAFWTQTGGTITAETIASSSSTALLPPPTTGIVLKTVNRNISTVVVKALVASTPSTLALGTDYEIEDATTGLIRILPGATLPMGITSITADYTAGAVTTTAAKTQILAGATPQVIGAFKLVGDPTSGRPTDVEVWRAEVTPSAAIGWISESHAQISLSGEILSDDANHPATPYYVTTER